MKKDLIVLTRGVIRLDIDETMEDWQDEIMDPPWINQLRIGAMEDWYDKVMILVVDFDETTDDCSDKRESLKLDKNMDP